jgi:ERCC4-type nuclease
MAFLKVDTREPSEITTWLSESCIEFDRTCLETGDFIINDEIVIERKTWADFISSISDGRLMKQADRLKEFKKAYILISGDFEQALQTTKMHRHAPIGAIASLTIRRGITVVMFPNFEDAMYFISRIVAKYKEEVELLSDKQKAE